MSKRANGEGRTWFIESKQLWNAAIMMPSGARKTKASKDKAIVDDWLNEQRLLLGRNLHVEPSSLTLAEWVKTYVESYNRPQVRQRTYERNQSLIKHMDEVGSTAIQQVKPAQLQNLYNSMAENGFSGETRKKVHNLIKAALNQAVLNRLVQTNPASAIKAPRVTRDEIEIFTQEELSLLMETAKQHRLYPSMLLAITTGMRLGEVLGIRWKDVNLKTGVLSVKRSLQATSTGIIFEPPKTEKGKRKIPLPPQTVAALTEYKIEWDKSRADHPGEDDLIFVTTAHTPLSPQSFRSRFWNKMQIITEFTMNNRQPKPMSEKKTFETILEECRQQKDWKQFNNKTFHALRHTYATTLLSSGVPIVDVSRVLGHSKVSTTLDIYGHAMPENFRLIAEKIAGAFLPPLQTEPQDSSVTDPLQTK